MTATPLLEIQGVSKFFPLAKGQMLHAVEGVSFALHPGETLGLVGESGCGKSTLGRVLVGLYGRDTGAYTFESQPVPLEPAGRWRRTFSRKVQMVFQDPYGSLNPRMPVGDSLAEGPDNHGLWKGSQREEAIAHWLQKVGLSPQSARRFPHEFSGGQRQRIGIARALALEPKLVVCDEPISALDASVQAQIVTLLQNLQKQMGTSYVFIAHGLDMVQHISHRVAVMYSGQLVELGPTSAVYQNPQHPYTQALLAANPIADPMRERSRNHTPLPGEVASPINPGPGCRFGGRCPLATDHCRRHSPPLTPREGGRLLACFER